MENPREVSNHVPVISTTSGAPEHEIPKHEQVLNPPKPEPLPPQRQQGPTHRQVEGNADTAGLVAQPRAKKTTPFHKLVVIPKLVEDLADDNKAETKKDPEDCDPALGGKVAADEAGKNGRTPLGVPDPVPSAQDEHQMAIDAVDTNDNMSTDPKVLAKGIEVATQADKDLKRLNHQMKVLCSEPSCPMQE